MPRNAPFYRRTALAPLCLCLVAGLHAWRVAHLPQTPWKGGGFGMFSTVDSEAARFLRCYAVLETGEQIPLAVPQVLAGWEAELRVVPTLARLTALAERLTELPDNPANLAQVRAEVWRYRFQADRKQLRAERMLETTVPRLQRQEELP